MYARFAIVLLAGFLALPSRISAPTTQGALMDSGPCLSHPGVPIAYFCHVTLSCRVLCGALYS